MISYEHNCFHTSPFTKPKASSYQSIFINNSHFKNWNLISGDLPNTKAAIFITKYRHYFSINRVYPSLICIDNKIYESRVCTRNRTLINIGKSWEREGGGVGIPNPQSVKTERREKSREICPWYTRGKIPYKLSWHLACIIWCLLWWKTYGPVRPFSDDVAFDL